MQFSKLQITVLVLTAIIGGVWVLLEVNKVTVITYLDSISPTVLSSEEEALLQFMQELQTDSNTEAKTKGGSSAEDQMQALSGLQSTDETSVEVRQGQLKQLETLKIN